MGYRYVKIIVAASAAVAGPAHAQALTAKDIWTQFNAVISDNFDTSADVEGRLVAGNIENANSSTFYNNPNPLAAPSAYQALNALTITSCQSCNVDNGGSVNWVTSIGGAPGVSFNLNAGGGNPAGSVKQNDPSFAMSDFTTPLNNAETIIAGLAANSTATITANSITFNVAPVDNMSVFDITASQLETPNASINFDFNGAQGPLTGIIINVTGATSFNELSSMNFNPTTYEDQHVIWNFDGFTSLSFYQWGGAILAGDATVSNQNALNGFLYAENLTGNGELHDYPLLGVPEPSTWAMLLAGFAGLGFAGRCTARQAAALA